MCYFSTKFGYCLLWVMGKICIWRVTDFWAAFVIFQKKLLNVCIRFRPVFVSQKSHKDTAATCVFACCARFLYKQTGDQMVQVRWKGNQCLMTSQHLVLLSVQGTGRPLCHTSSVWSWGWLTVSPVMSWISGKNKRLKTTFPIVINFISLRSFSGVAWVAIMKYIMFVD